MEGKPESLGMGKVAKIMKSPSSLPWHWSQCHNVIIITGKELPVSEMWWFMEKHFDHFLWPHRWDLFIFASVIPPQSVLRSDCPCPQLPLDLKVPRYVTYSYYDIYDFFPIYWFYYITVLPTVTFKMWKPLSVIRCNVHRSPNLGDDPLCHRPFRCPGLHCWDINGFFYCIHPIAWEVWCWVLHSHISIPTALYSPLLTWAIVRPALARVRSVDGRQEGASRSFHGDMQNLPSLLSRVLSSPLSEVTFCFHGKTFSPCSPESTFCFLGKKLTGAILNR